jgi:glycosyltransferase involved in cell wall biosynthesis
MQMLFSFIIPFFNSEAHIATTIQSVVDCQYEEFEILLINDGSKDKSLQICQSFQKRYPLKIRILEHEGQKNKGVSASRRLGVELSQGQFIYFLDSDDILLPRVITRYLEVFSRDEQVILIHGKIELLSRTTSEIDLEKAFDLGPVEKHYNLSDEPYFLTENHICNSTACFRKESISGLDFSFPQAFQIEDWILWTLLSERGRFCYIPEPIVQYRYHENSATFEVNKKGYVYYLYSRLELYMVVNARAQTKLVLDKASILLYEYSKSNPRRLAFRLFRKAFIKDFVKSIIKRK